MKKNIVCVLLMLLFVPAFAQDSLVVKLRDQYQSKIKDQEINVNGLITKTDTCGNFKLMLPVDSVLITAPGFTEKKYAVTAATKELILDKKFSWKDLLTPMFYIMSGGLWFILFVVFAETGLFAGFFLPGDSLLFIAGIYSDDLVATGMGLSGIGSFAGLILLGVAISIAGILGNYVGYWFGRKSGPFLFERKDTFFFRKKYLFQARDFYDKHGGGAIVIARFLPIIRTFAPIIAGIVGMERKKFTYYNIIGCVAWVFAMLFGGHYLQKLFLRAFNFDLREHLEVIVIGIVLVTTAPILIKLFFGKSKSAIPTTEQPAD